MPWKTFAHQVHSWSPLCHLDLVLQDIPIGLGKVCLSPCIDWLAHCTGREKCWCSWVMCLAALQRGESLFVGETLERGETQFKASTIIRILRRASDDPPWNPWKETEPRKETEPFQEMFLAKKGCSFGNLSEAWRMNVLRTPKPSNNMQPESRHNLSLL